MFQFDINTLLVAGLVFLRIGAIIMSLPIFGDAPTPIQVRILISISLTIFLFPIAQQNSWQPDASLDAVGIAWTVIREVSIGLVLGFIARVSFDGMIMAASLIGYQMGFSTSHLFIPDASSQLDGFTAFHRILMILIFFSLNLHHIFINAIVETLKVLPPGQVAPHTDAIAALLLNATSRIFSVAIQLAAPILVALMFAMAALGLVARAVPQFNVFVMSFPMSFLVGLAVYVATTPFFPGWMQSNFVVTVDQFSQAIKALKM